MSLFVHPLISVTLCLTGRDNYYSPQIQSGCFNSIWSLRYIKSPTSCQAFGSNLYRCKESYGSRESQDGRGIPVVVELLAKTDHFLLLFVYSSSVELLLMRLSISGNPEWSLCIVFWSLLTASTGTHISYLYDMVCLRNIQYLTWPLKLQITGPMHKDAANCCR